MRINITSDSSPPPPPPPDGWPYPGIEPGYRPAGRRSLTTLTSSSDPDSGDGSDGNSKGHGSNGGRGGGHRRRELQQGSAGASGSGSGGSGVSSGGISGLPQDLSWVQLGKVSPVRNQYSQGMTGFGCGSCWAFATIAAVESAYLIYKNATTYQVCMCMC